MEKRWTILEKTDEALINELVETINVDPILANLLGQRAVKDFDTAKSFFRPALEDLHDPFLMKDMDIAIGRLNSAIRNGEKIMIYGDYDVDGTTSVALVYSFLRRYYPNLEFYIPDRYKEGYGVSSQGIEAAADAGCRLIISLDCGIKAVNKVKYATKFGIDFIVCDHHTPGEQLPEAVACLDPKRPDCPYPFKDLSGCGVGFKFMQAFCRHNGYPEEDLYEYLDLVAVSVASDIVSITGENRIMATFGLERLNTSPRTGLQSIIRMANMENREFVLSDIVFKIGPRINAAGRIQSGRDAVELLISEDESLAKRMSDNINVHNETRKDLDRLTTQEALEMLNSNPSQRFEDWVASHILPEQLVPQIEIDAEISLKDINSKFFRILKQFMPFGPGNMKPLFVTRRVIDYGTSKVVGKNKDHLKLELIEEHSSSIIQGVGFSMGEHIDKVKSGDPFDVVYSIEENVFNGKTSIQIMVKDLRFPH
ncbi:MAG: DHH family phosphoesterase [Bacteroidales bacterium]|nr:DHH family phosphoesterase [Bacteroidales bacterium]